MSKETETPAKKMDSMLAWPVAAAATVGLAIVAPPLTLFVFTKTLPLAMMTFLFGGGALAVTSAFVGDKEKTLGGRMMDNFKATLGALHKAGAFVMDAYRSVGADCRHVLGAGNRWAERQEAKSQAAKAASDSVSVSSPLNGKDLSAFEAAAKRGTPANDATAKPAAQKTAKPSA